MKTKLQSIRESKGLSQAELAKLAGVSQASICKYEKGLAKNPRLNNCIKIATALDCSIFELFL